jgi:hypothetical protein
LGGLPRFANTSPCASAAHRSKLANFSASLRCEPGGILRASSNASSARTPQSYLPVERRVSLLNSLNACVSLLTSPRACVSLLIAPRAPPAGSFRLGSLKVRPDLDDVLFPAPIFGTARHDHLNPATEHQSCRPRFVVKPSAQASRSPPSWYNERVMGHLLSPDLARQRCHSRVAHGGAIPILKILQII